MSPGKLQRKPQRLRSIHRKMSFAAFRRLPERLGWKKEYYGGQVHLSPGHVCVKLMLDLAPRAGPRVKGIRPVQPDDAGELEEPFLAAFARSPEYAGYPGRLFNRSAAKYLTGFFGEVRGPWLPVSVVAEVEGRLIGAALVKRLRSGPLLDCLFVHPRHSRQGWASALATRVVRGLLTQGETKLFSYVHLANESSLAWHEAFGFRELPDLWVASHRWRFYASELERLRKTTECAELDLSRLKQLTTHWQSETKRLEKLEGEDFWAAHPRFD